MVPLYSNKFPEANVPTLTVVPCIFPTVVTPSVPVTSPIKVKPDKDCAELAMPFTVEVKLLLDNDKALALMIGAVWATPPATVELIVFVDDDNAWEIATAVPATPLTVVLTLPPDTVLETELTAGAVAAAPLTVEVIVLVVLESVFVVVTALED